MNTILPKWALFFSVLAAIFLLSPAQAQVTVIYNPQDGTKPAGIDSLIQATDGNFYGTSRGGGRDDEDGKPGIGTIFKMTTGGQLTILKDFVPYENGSGLVDLVQGLNGDFYGVSATIYGGGELDYESTAFKITSAGVFTLIPMPEGYDWAAGLTRASNGDFYGGVSPGYDGYLFKMDTAGTVTTLHKFDHYLSHGSPNGKLAEGLDGNFYGTVTDGKGSLFKITPAGDYSVVHPFGPTFDHNLDGSSITRGLYLPQGLIRGSDGNFYGTAAYGGDGHNTEESGEDEGGGVIYRVTPAGVGTILHHFNDGTVPNDGFRPGQALVQATDGNFYGITTIGGAYDDGTIYKMTPAGVVTIIHHFSFENDGFSHPTILMQAKDGQLYGAARAYYSDVVFRLSLNRLAQTITFPAIGPVVCLQKVTLAATSSSGRKVAYGVVSGPATLSGNVVTFTGAGTVVLKATRVADGEYLAAEASQTITVSLAPQTITPFGVIPAKALGDAPFNLIPPTSSSSLGVTVTVKSGPATLSGNTLTITGLGVVTLAANQPGNALYTPASEVTTSFPVSQRAQTVSIGTISNKLANAAPFSVATSSSSKLPVTLSIQSGPATISGNTVTVTGPGTVVIAADQAGNGSYSPAPTVTKSFTVSPATQTISTASITTKLASAAPFAVSATASSQLLVTLSIQSGPATLSGNLVTLTGAGTVVIAANQAGNALYAAAPTVTKTFIVNAVTQKITLAAIPAKLVSDAPFNLSATASSLLPVTFAITSGPATIQGSTLTITGAGTVTVTASQPGDSVYLAAPPLVKTFTVSKLPQTIAFPALSAANVGQTVVLPVTSSAGLPIAYSVLKGSASISGNSVTFTTAGAVQLAANQAGNATYTSAARVIQTATVVKITQTLSAFPVVPAQVLGIAPFAITIPVASSGLPVTVTVTSGPATISGRIVTLTGTGRVYLTASQPGNGTYTAATASTVFGVAATQSITFPAPPSLPYQTTPFEITATANSGLPVTLVVVSGPATVSGHFVTLTGIGTVTLQATQPGNGTFPAAKAVTCAFNVTQITQTITFPAITARTVGSVVTLSATATSGLPVTYSLSGPATLSGKTLTLTGPGTVTVIARQGGNAIYTLAATKQIFTVTP